MLTVVERLKRSTCSSAVTPLRSTVDLTGYVRQIPDQWVIDIRTRRLAKSFEYWTPFALCAQSRLVERPNVAVATSGSGVRIVLVALVVLGGLLAGAGLLLAVLVTPIFVALVIVGLVLGGVGLAELRSRANP